MSQINYLKLKNNPAGDNLTSIYGVLYYMLKGAMIRMFEYKNLPEEVDPLILESILFDSGVCLLFQNGGYTFTTKSAKKGKLNFNGILVKAHPIALNGNVKFPDVRVVRSYNIETGQMLEPTGAMIWNNHARLSSIEILDPFLKRLDYIWQTIGRAEALARVTRIYETDNENQKKVLINELQTMVDSVCPIAVVSTGAARDLTNSKDSGLSNVNQLIGGCWDDFHSTLEFMFTLLGINNANTDKKERLITDEVNSNNAQIRLFIKDPLQCRKKAIEQFNKIYGTNIEVDITEDIKIQFEIESEEDPEKNPTEE